MDFFEAQEHARKSTRTLVVLFILAVLGLVLATNLMAMVIATYGNGFTRLTVDTLRAAYSWQTALSVTGAVIAIIGLGTLYKLNVLRGGGKVVAESLGGRPISADTTDPELRRLLNVVDEMAIASGTPVPPVYLMTREAGINAFAAGNSPYDAVIGITLGAVRELNREQLQGVIAHEFSHILNGDMRLNMRLMGIIHGIMMIGYIGGYLLRAGAYRSYGYRSRNRGNNPLPFIGLGLMVIGYGGTFFGNMIKAAVSRQREFLADASSVQFTRNKDGIASALRRIGGHTVGSAIASPMASEVSHAFFGSGVKSWMGGLFATHPPLDERIRRIDPGWDGRFDTRPPKPLHPKAYAPGEREMGEALAAGAVSGMASGVAVPPERPAGQQSSPREINALDAIDRIGHPTQAHLSQARALLAAMPQPLREAAADPFGACAALYALAAHRDDAIRQRQWHYLSDRESREMAELAQTLYPHTEHLDPTLRLPLIELALGAVRNLSPEQHHTLRTTVRGITTMDARLSLFEWCLNRLLLVNLSEDGVERPPKGGTPIPIHQAKPACSVVLSIAAYADGDRGDEAQADFDGALPYLQLPGVALIPPDQVDLKRFESALDQLVRLNPLHKKRLLKAVAGCIHADGEVTAEEAELLRAIADSLDCPMPPPLPRAPKG